MKASLIFIEGENFDPDVIAKKHGIAGYLAHWIKAVEKQHMKNKISSSEAEKRAVMWEMFQD